MALLGGLLGGSTGSTNGSGSGSGTTTGSLGGTVGDVLGGVVGTVGGVVDGVLGGVTGGSGPSGTGSSRTDTILDLDLGGLLDLNIGAGGNSLVTVDATVGTTGSTASSPLIDLGVDLGGLTGGNGGLLGGLLGGGTAGGGLIPDTVGGLVDTVDDLLDTLLGGGTSGTPTSPTNPTIPTNPGTPGQTVTGTAGADVLQGTAGNDTINALGGNDLIIPGTGNDTINGGAGRDSVVMGNAMAQYTAAAKDGVLALQNKTTGEVDILTSVERVGFSDHTLALDFNGEAGQGFRLYQAAFDRAPDTPGLTHNVRLLDAGLSLHDLAQGFIDSPEFLRTYGANLSNERFVTELYDNTLHRAPDATGLQNWTNALNNGVLDRAQVLIGFSESTENHNQTDAQLQNGILLDYSVMA